MLKRFAAIIAVLLMALALLPAATAQDDNFIRYPLLNDPEQLNPFISDTIAVSTVTRNIFEGLVAYDARTDEYNPGLAESWTVSEDLMTFTFNLRQGVLYHAIDGVEYADGEREMTAQDIMWNYMTALSGDQDVSVLAGGLSNILGAPEFTEGEADSVEGLEVIDDFTFQITLSVPDRRFLNSGATLSIVSPVAYEQLGADFDGIPVGTGPFQFVEWLRQDRLVLEANPDYWREGFPRTAGVRYINYGEANTALLDYRQGELDFLFSFPTGQRNAIIEEFAEDFNEQPGLHLRYFGFDMSQGFFAENPLVRQAFNYAFDRETSWDLLAEGARFPANLGMLPPAMPASTPSTIYTYDLDRAAELLAEAGFPNGEGMPEITLQVLAALAEEPAIVVWQNSLAEIGVTLNIAVEESGTYWDNIRSDNVILFINGWAAGVPDPYDVFNYIILDGDNSMLYDDPVVNDLIRQAEIELDPDVREEIYQQVHDIIMEESVVVPSGYSKVTWLQKSWVDGFAPGGGGTHTAPLAEVSLNR